MATVTSSKNIVFKAFWYAKTSWIISQLAVTDTRRKTVKMYSTRHSYTVSCWMSSVRFVQDTVARHDASVSFTHRANHSANHPSLHQWQLKIRLLCSIMNILNEHDTHVKWRISKSKHQFFELLSILSNTIQITSVWGTRTVPTFFRSGKIITM